MRNFPIPELGVFCILIVNIISKISQELFSLLSASNYHYNKGTVLVNNITTLMIHRWLFCIIFLKPISLGWVINIGFIYIYVIVWKMGIMNHYTFKYYDIIIIFVFQIKTSSIIFFSQISNLCFLCIFHLNLLSQSNNSINFAFLLWSTEPPFICYLLVIR